MRHLNYLPVLVLLLLSSLVHGGAANSRFLGRFQLEIDSAASGSLGLSMAVHTRFIQRNDYFILTYVIVIDERGNVVAESLSDPHPIVARNRERNEEGLIDIARQVIPLDLGGFTGPVGVGVMSQIFDRNGRPVRNADAEAFEIVEIRGGECDTTSISGRADVEELPSIDIDPASIEWEPSGHLFGPNGIAVINQASREKQE